MPLGVGEGDHPQKILRRMRPFRMIPKMEASGTGKDQDFGVRGVVTMRTRGELGEIPGRGEPYITALRNVNLGQ